MFITAVDEEAATGPLAEHYRQQRVDRAVYEFAAKVATDAASIEQVDVDALRAIGLSDGDVADVVFAASAHSLFTRVLDALGAQLDAQTADAFAPAALKSMTVGRPAADGR